MLQGRGRLRLALETSQRAAVVHEIGAQHFQRDRAVQALLVRFEHQPHSAAADEAGDPIRPELGAISGVRSATQEALCDQLFDPPVARLHVREQFQVLPQVAGQLRMSREQGGLGNGLAGLPPPQELI